MATLGQAAFGTTDRMPASPVEAATAIRMHTSPFGAKGLRTVHNVGGLVTAIASRQLATNIAAPGQGFGRPFENARSIDAVCSGHALVRCTCPLSRSLSEAKRTWRFAPHMSAFDPKRTLHSHSSAVPISKLVTGALSL